MAETIVAIATPPGRGGIGIVRVSGAGTREIAQSILGVLPTPRMATHRTFTDSSGQAIDEGIALFFAAPGSFTGEDVLELQGHGGPVVLDLVTREVLALGARMARPGEFTERAFLNDKMDLVQAEAVADLIDSASASAARCAIGSLQGEFSARVHNLVARLTELRLFVEAAIDFPEEEVDFLSDQLVVTRLTGLSASFDSLQSAVSQGVLLQEGIQIALIGRPNAGKSSLMNRFSGRDTSIVTDIPGTTRDLVTELVSVNGVPVHFVDTAGIRQAGDEIEAEGVRRSLAAAEQASHTLLVVDVTQGDVTSAVGDLLSSLAEGGVNPENTTVVLNKIDRLGSADSQPDTVQGLPAVAVSALSGAGFTALCDHVSAAAGYAPAGESGFIARRRHLEALLVAHQALDRGRAALDETGAGELLAEELRLAQDALGEITGVVTADDLLGAIFSSFCIGK